MQNLIKISLAVLFFICLLEMPYGYFQLVRFIALVGFLVLAYQANQRAQQMEMVIYVILAILFQPLLKVSLGRQLWNIIDVLVGIALIVSVFLRPKAKVG